MAEQQELSIEHYKNVINRLSAQIGTLSIEKASAQARVLELETMMQEFKGEVAKT